MKKNRNAEATMKAKIVGNETADGDFDFSVVLTESGTEYARIPARGHDAARRIRAVLELHSPAVWDTDVERCANSDAE